MDCGLSGYSSGQPFFIRQTKKGFRRNLLIEIGRYAMLLSDSSTFDENTVPIQLYIPVFQTHLGQDIFQIVSVLRTFEVYAREVVEDSPDTATVLAMQDGMSVLSDFLFHRNILLCFNRRL